MSNRLEKLRSRKLFRWVLTYIAVAWVVLQVVDVLGNRWDWSQAFQRTLDILLIAGFLSTTVLAWFHGEKGQRRVTGIEAGLLGGIVILTGVAMLIIGEQHDDEDSIEEQTADETSTSSVTASKSGAGALDQDSFSYPLSSIAILPCANRTGDDELAYFVEGIHAELIDELANLAGLDVRARRSVMRFADTDVPLQQVASALRVGSVIACEVFNVGESVRIRTELLGLNPENLLWSNAYDRDTKDVVVLYRDVARQVAEEIRVAISPAENLRLDQQPTIDANAYRFYLDGRYNLYTIGTRAGRDRSVADLTASISLDPDYAPAWAWLAQAYLDYVDHHALLNTEVKSVISASIPQHAAIIASSSDAEGQLLLTRLAFDAAERAVATDPVSATSWIAFGWAQLQINFDFAAAMAAYDRALSLQPGSSRARASRANLLLNLGQWSASLEESNLALLDDPLNPRRHLRAATARFYAGDPERAIREIEILIEANPSKPDFKWALALLLAEFGRHTESNEVLEKQIPLMGDDTIADELALMGYNYGCLGLHEAAREVIEQLDVMEQDGQLVSPFIKSFPLVGLGEFDAAFAWLDQAFGERDPWLAGLHLWPAFVPLRGDPRFDNLVRRVGLPQVAYPCYDCD